MLLGSGGGRSVCLWRCRLLSVPSGEQASGRRWDCSGLGHVAQRCFGTKWYGARLFKLDKYAMFSFAMTSGLASDSDKLKIIITLRRAQKFGDSGPYKNFDFLYNPYLHDFFRNFNQNLASHIWDNGTLCVNGLICLINYFSNQPNPSAAYYICEINDWVCSDLFAM